MAKSGHSIIKGIKTKASRESSSGSTSDDVAVADENKNRYKIDHVVVLAYTRGGYDNLLY